MVIFRTAASAEHGFGRLSRCAYLASLLKKGAGVHFLIDPDKLAIKFLQEKNLPFTPVDRFKNLDNMACRGIVFDLYGFASQDKDLLDWAGQKGIGTVQVADRVLERLKTDFTVDPAFVPALPGQDQGHLLSGPEYAILHHKYRHFHQVKRKYRQKVRYLLLVLAHAGGYRACRQVIDTLTRQGFRLKVAPGFIPRALNPKILRRLYPGLRFVGRVESLARSFFEADAALITPGVAAYEAAAAGTPALYFYSSQEEEAYAETLAGAGLGIKVSSFAGLDDTELVAKVRSLSWEQRLAMGTRGKEVVDGIGAHRLLAFLQAHNLL